MKLTRTTQKGRQLRRTRTKGRGVVVAVVFAMVASMLVLATSPVAAADSEVAVGPGDSIQDTLDAAAPGTTITVRGDHVENLWINKSGIKLIGKNGASITMPEQPVLTPCQGTLICVIPESILQQDPPPPSDYLDGVTIEGLTLTNPQFDAIGVVFTNNVRIQRNTIVDPGCDGVFVIFATGFRIRRNVVSGAECGGIHVVASRRGDISRNRATGSTFSGIAVDDTSKVDIDRNTANGNCIGIGVTDGPDGGNGVQDKDFASRDVSITRNKTNANNGLCFPFGPDTPIGVTGILVSGVTKVKVQRNVANNNTSSETSITAGGIFVADFPNQDGSVFKTTTGAKVLRNKATGNSSADTPGDLVLVMTGKLKKVNNNKCEFGIPDPSWCTAS